jgi:hypothetical protein
MTYYFVYLRLNIYIKECDTCAFFIVNKIFFALCFFFSYFFIEDMAEQATQRTTTTDLEATRGKNIFCVLINDLFFNVIEQTSESNMMDTTTREQQIQQLNAVDDATLQAVLSSMTESEMQAFLDELNKTGKACE